MDIKYTKKQCLASIK